MLFLPDEILLLLFSFLYKTNQKKKKLCNCFELVYTKYHLISKQFLFILPQTFLSTIPYQIKNINHFLNLKNICICSYNMTKSYELLIRHINIVKNSNYVIENENKIFDLPVSIHSFMSHITIIYNLLKNSNKIKRLDICCDGRGVQIIIKNVTNQQLNYETSFQQHESHI